MKPSKLPTGIKLIMAIAAVELLVMTLYKGYWLTNDSVTYLDAWNNSWSQFQIDNYRTPVYPLFLGIIQMIVGPSHVYISAAVVQSIIAIIAIPYFHRIAERLTGSEQAALLTTFLFATCPFFLWIHHFILTESLAVSGGIFLVYHVVAIRSDKSLWHCLWASLWLLLLIFMRPAFVYMLPVLLVASLLLVVWKGNRKRAVVLAAGVVCVSFLLLGYMQAFKSRYGVFTTSRVSVVNSYAFVREYGILDSKQSNDKSLAKFIDQCYAKHGKEVYNTDNILVVWHEIDYMLTKWDLPTIQSAVSKSIAAHKALWLDKVMLSFKRCMSESFFLEGSTFGPLAPFVVNGGQGCIVLLLVVYALYIIMVGIRRKRLLWTELVLLMLGASNVIVVVVGSPNDYSRLLLPSKFIYVVMAAQLLMVAFRHRYLLRRLM